MTKYKINTIINKINSPLLLLIYAALFFVGFACGESAPTMIVCACICALLVAKTKSIKPLLGFVTLLPLGISYTISKATIAALIFSGVVILLCVAYLLMQPHSKEKPFAWGQLIGGLAIAFVLMFFVGIGKINYINNLYYLLSVLAIMFVYVLCVNTKDYNFVANTIIVFALMTDLEVCYLGGGALVWASSSILCVNMLAIGVSLSICKNWTDAICYNILSIIALLFTIIYCQSFAILVATCAVYVLCGIYFAAKNVKKSIIVLASWVVAASLYIIVDISMLGGLDRHIVQAYLNIDFSGLAVAFQNLATSVVFGLGFGTPVSSNVVYVLASVGVFGAILLLVLAIQIVCSGAKKVTYKKIFWLISAICLIAASLLESFASLYCYIIIFAFLSLAELEDYSLSRAPIKQTDEWTKKAQKMLEKNKEEKTFYEKYLKRIFDFCLSLLALIILSPVFLAVFVTSKISIGGNAIFAQYRPGKNGKVFKLYKFRSMTNKTDENGNLLPDEQRITKFGKIIRKLSIDELPQLVNILKGDMSIVGPRPRLVKDMVFYDQDTLLAYSVKPGLTGPSQVSGGRSEASWETIFEADKNYASHITFWGDVIILFKTVLAVLKSESALGGAQSSKREYYYGDYLLKTGKITENQYASGQTLAKQIIDSKAVVEYNPQLKQHNN